MKNLFNAKQPKLKIKSVQIKLTEGEGYISCLPKTNQVRRILTRKSHEYMSYTITSANTLLGFCCIQSSVQDLTE